MAHPCQLPSLGRLAAGLAAEAGACVQRIAGNLRERSLTFKEDWEERREIAGLVKAENVKRRTLVMQGLPPTFDSATQSLEAVHRMPYQPVFGTDMETSLLGFGGSAGAGSFMPVQRSAAVDAVREAHRLGVNLFDTAPIYGVDRDGERILRDGLRHAPRSSYYLCTKVGRYLEERGRDTVFGGKRWVSTIDYGFKATVESVHRSLEELGTDYLDIVWVHDPHYAHCFQDVKNGVMHALMHLKDEGLVRYAGMAGYDTMLIKSLIKHFLQFSMSGQHDSAVPRIDVIQPVSRYNILDHGLLLHDTYPQRLPEWARNWGIGTISAAPMAMGLLSPRRPPSWHPAPAEIVAACREVVEYCMRHRVCPTRVCLHYAMQQRLIISSHLTGLATVPEVRSAVDVAGLAQLSPAESACLNWAVGRLERLRTNTWQERDAVISHDGYLSEKAKRAMHFRDSDYQKLQQFQSGSPAMRYGANEDKFAYGRY
eukprot:TRINITY_DN776_c0_g1_i1.p1 TRINITY_DN776_c0_g1~~TRINITY_DN776_c0_g1_i1.p1  ORF type:complete len:508 (+),score=145.79 TRINITY_DN776_c0_g1_i1:77-1525(+)